MAKHIFVTGGVTSSLGKGLTASSLGCLLKARGFRVIMQKLDPYINVDPGTMNPFQHGEVFVTEDGGETDLDLGHYERFVDENLHRESNCTTGAIYRSVIAKERRGEYLGQTVQVIPHITNEIKASILGLGDNADIVITEVGGTVGDIEILPFLEAIRQVRNDVGRDNVAYVHVTLVPYIGPAGEQKTKPTQHSVTELRSRGIQPDAIVCRSAHQIPEALRVKISDLCDVALEGVVTAIDVNDIYEIPLVLQEAGLDAYLCSLLHLEGPAPVLDDWREMVERARTITKKVRIGLVGKYVELHDAYLSVVEAIRHGALSAGVNAEIVWIDAEAEENTLMEEVLADLDGVCVPGGFGVRGVEGKIAAIRYARENNLPFLGLCLGLQCAFVEFARNVADLPDAHSSEFDPDTPHPVIDLMERQRKVSDMGGTMRLGNYPCRLLPGTRAQQIYGDLVVYERHRHRYEVNEKYRDRIESAGLVCSGVSPDNRLAEIIELPDHPFFLATQFHPEFTSRPNRANPLFREFLAVAAEHAQKRDAFEGLSTFDKQVFIDLSTVQQDS